MSNLHTKRCLACEAGVPPLTAEKIATLLTQTPDWEVADGTALRRRYTFKNFYKTMAFVNAVAWIAHQENHHPDLEVGYNTCVVQYTTHALGGLSENDFICAAKVSQLTENE